MRGGSSHISYDTITSKRNLFSAWREFSTGKMNKNDVLDFSQNVEEKLFRLHSDLRHGVYTHGRYTTFRICDPKPRIINKASVRDRIVHHAVVRVLEPFFEKRFIYDSYSSRKNKGTHRAIERLTTYAWKLSQNNTKHVWYLKCDIKKFFDSVHHHILLDILSKYFFDKRVISLIKDIVQSFEYKENRGLPLGNYTSQLFANVYMNEFDQFIKREQKIRYYIRYSDDCIFLSRDRLQLEKVLENIQFFLPRHLRLELHKNKVTFGKFSQGIDFLGYIVFPHYRILRTRTKRRMLRKFSSNPDYSVLQSYLGMTKHGNEHATARLLKKLFYRR